MADLVISKAPDIEAIIADDIRQFFADDIHFDALFPKSEGLKVGTDHPFATLYQQTPKEGESYNVSGLFPSIAVIDTHWDKLVETPTHPQVVQIKSEIIAEIKAQGRKAFIMSKQTLAALEEAFKVTTTLKGEGFQTFRKTEIAVEVWSDNNVIKGKILDLISLYLISQRRYDLHTNYGIMIEEGTITGERSGIYNFDFGMALYGSMVRFSVGYDVYHYVVKNFTIGVGVSVEMNSELI